MASKPPRSSSHLRGDLHKPFSWNCVSVATVYATLHNSSCVPHFRKSMAARPALVSTDAAGQRSVSQALFSIIHYLQSVPNPREVLRHNAVSFCVALGLPVGLDDESMDRFLETVLHQATGSPVYDTGTAFLNSERQLQHHHNHPAPSHTAQLHQIQHFTLPGQHPSLPASLQQPSLGYLSAAAAAVAHEQMVYGYCCPTLPPSTPAPHMYASQLFIPQPLSPLQPREHLCSSRTPSSTALQLGTPLTIAPLASRDTADVTAPHVPESSLSAEEPCSITSPSHGSVLTRPLDNSRCVASETYSNPPTTPPSASSCINQAGTPTNSATGGVGPPVGSTSSTSHTQGLSTQFSCIGSASELPHERRLSRDDPVSSVGTQSSCAIDPHVYHHFVNADALHHSAGASASSSSAAYSDSLSRNLRISNGQVQATAGQTSPLRQNHACSERNAPQHCSSHPTTEVVQFTQSQANDINDMNTATAAKAAASGGLRGIIEVKNDNGTTDERRAEQTSLSSSSLTLTGTVEHSAPVFQEERQCSLDANSIIPEELTESIARTPTSLSELPDTVCRKAPEDEKHEDKDRLISQGCISSHHCRPSDHCTVNGTGPWRNDTGTPSTSASGKPDLFFVEDPSYRPIHLCFQETVQELTFEEKVDVSKGIASCSASFLELQKHMETLQRQAAGYPSRKDTEDIQDVESVAENDSEADFGRGGTATDNSPDKMLMTLLESLKKSTLSFFYSCPTKLFLYFAVSILQDFPLFTSSFSSRCPAGCCPSHGCRSRRPHRQCYRRQHADHHRLSSRQNPPDSSDTSTAPTNVMDPYHLVERTEKRRDTSQSSQSSAVSVEPVWTWASSHKRRRHTRRRSFVHSSEVINHHVSRSSPTSTGRRTTATVEMTLNHSHSDTIPHPNMLPLPGAGDASERGNCCLVQGRSGDHMITSASSQPNALINHTLPQDVVEASGVSAHPESSTLSGSTSALSLDAHFADHILNLHQIPPHLYRNVPPRRAEARWAGENGDEGRNLKRQYGRILPTTSTTELHGDTLKSTGVLGTRAMDQPSTALDHSLPSPKHIPPKDEVLLQMPQHIITKTGVVLPPTDSRLYLSKVVGVVWDKIHNSWVVNYTLLGRRYFQHFPAKRYGFLEGRQLAIELRLAKDREKSLIEGTVRGNVRRGDGGNRCDGPSSKSRKHRRGRHVPGSAGIHNEHFLLPPTGEDGVASSMTMMSSSPRESQPTTVTPSASTAASLHDESPPSSSLTTGRQDQQTTNVSLNHNNTDGGGVNLHHQQHHQEASASADTRSRGISHIGVSNSLLSSSLPHLSMLSQNQQPQPKIMSGTSGATSLSSTPSSTASSVSSSAASTVSSVSSLSCTVGRTPPSLGSSGGIMPCFTVVTSPSSPAPGRNVPKGVSQQFACVGESAAVTGDSVTSRSLSTASASRSRSRSPNTPSALESTTLADRPAQSIGAAEENIPKVSEASCYGSTNHCCSMSDSMDTVQGFQDPVVSGYHHHHHHHHHLSSQQQQQSQLRTATTNAESAANQPPDLTTASLCHTHLQASPAPVASGLLSLSPHAQLLQSQSPPSAFLSHISQLHSIVDANASRTF